MAVARLTCFVRLFVHEIEIDLREIFECAHLKYTVYGHKVVYIHICAIAVPLVWGSLRLAPTTAFNLMPVSVLIKDVTAPFLGCHNFGEAFELRAFILLLKSNYSQLPTLHTW